MAKILSTHTGSLPRTEALLAADADRRANGPSPQHAEVVRSAVAEVVAKQRQIGIDIPNDGEYGHAMAGDVDYAAWWTYSFGRFGGLEPSTDADWATWGAAEHIEPAPGEIRLTSFDNRRDWQKFADVYGKAGAGVGLQSNGDEAFPVVTSELTYTGQDEVQRDITNLQDALAASGYEHGYLAAIGPASAARVPNAFYRTDQELLDAVTAALREEYAAILNAGLTLQLDDPGLTESWDQIDPEPPLDDYRRWVAKGVAAINTALDGLDTSRARLHVCWGSWHGPHTTDLPLEDVIDVLLEANVGGFVVEAANVRHEHEWRVWKGRELPEGFVVAPGVVSHATNVVEHPQLVADRLVKWAELLGGPERVIATTDCGLGGRIHPQIAWAKLESLVEGTRLANEQLGV